MAGVKQPADKSYFILPDLGEGVAEAELIEWRVEPGQKVDEHQTLAEMETDKARVEVPSPWKGTIGELHGSAGDIIEVGSKLVSYAVSGASAPKQKKPVEVSAEVEAKAAQEDAGTVVGTMSDEVTVADRFSRQSESNGSVATTGKALATPAVRRIARELGVEINKVTGTGRGGRVTASDVQAWAENGGAGLRPASGGPALRAGDATAQRAVPPATGQRPVPPGEGIAQRIPIRGTRRKIAQALSHSLHTAAHFTVVDEADATALEAKRKELIYATGEKISLLPFILAALCKGLRLHPSLNANVDDENKEILIRSDISIGCAVDTDDGLMVPVIFNADQLSIVELSRRVADVAARCKNRTIPREELMGGTFTISNVGSYGGIFATPIINYPEVAIIAAGRAYDKVMPRDGGIYLGKSLPLSVSCDHRVVDGAEGARFLNTVKRLLEDPSRLLSADAG